MLLLTHAPVQSFAGASYHSRQLYVHTTSGSCSASSLNMIFITALILQLLLCLARLPSVSANVEKGIFVAPHEPRELLFTGANDGQSVELEALHLSLPKLTPSSLCGTTEPCRSLKITLNTSFLDGGEKQWILLDHLEPRRRYEVRICWAATVSPPSENKVLQGPLLNNQKSVTNGFHPQPLHASSPPF